MDHFLSDERTSTPPTIPAAKCPDWSDGDGPTHSGPTMPSNSSSPASFIRELWLRCHRPELIAAPDAILLTDRGEVCSFEEWVSPDVPRLKILSHDFYCEVPGLPLSAVAPDGSPRSIVAVLYENAEFLVRAAVSIQSFWE